MSATYRYQDPFRPIWEFFSIGTWLASVVAFVLAAVLSPLPSKAFISLAGVAAGMALWRAIPAVALWRKRRRLLGHELDFISIKELQAKVTKRPDAIWLGRGFTWSQQQAQQVYDITRRDPESLTPRDDKNIGNRWIHGIGDKETDLYIPIDHNASHMLLAATTRAIKTRFMEVLIAQAIMRGESVIVIDPKGDSDLHTSMRKICALLGREKDFVFFHPAFTSKSHRIDTLANFNRSTALATRVATVTPSEGGGDTFAAFGQMAVNNVNQGILLIDEKPNLIKIRRILEGGPTSLVRQACEAHFDKVEPSWREGIKAYMRKAKDANDDETKAVAYIAFYRENLQNNPRCASSELEGLLTMFEHDRTHFSKMVTGLMPTLNMLTSGSLGRLLSPDHTDTEDTRPITDFNRIIENRQVAYIGLDSLSDVMVGSAIGALMLSDLTSVAGDRYNYGKDLRPVNLYVDECAEVVNDPFIAMLNKAGGAKFRITAATQVFSDFAARVGSDAKAKMILGNLNNVVAGRIIDKDTQEYVCETMPSTVVRHVEYGIDAKASTKDVADFAAGVKETLKETEVELVPPPLLGTLPNLEYFARISAGRVVKGRVPILAKDPP